MFRRLPMKKLLIEEMKRAVHLLESKEDFSKYKNVKYDYGTYPTLDKEIVELQQLLLMIRKHSVQFEKEFIKQ